MSLGDGLRSLMAKLDPAPTSARATGTKDGTGHPVDERQLAGSALAATGGRDGHDAPAGEGAAAPPRPFLGDPGGPRNRPTEEYTSERIEVEQDSASDSG